MSEFLFEVNAASSIGAEAYVTVALDAEAWDEITNTTPEYYGDEISIIMLKEALSTAYRMYGYAFDIKRFSPKHLYEALASKQLAFTVNGDVPSNLID